MMTCKITDCHLTAIRSPLCSHDFYIPLANWQLQNIWDQQACTTQGPNEAKNHTYQIENMNSWCSHAYLNTKARLHARPMQRLVTHRLSQVNAQTIMVKVAWSITHSWNSSYLHLVNILALPLNILEYSLLPCGTKKRSVHINKFAPKTQCPLRATSTENMCARRRNNKI